MPLRVGQKSEQDRPKPFSTEWILAPPEAEQVRYAPELPPWIPSERKTLALFVLVMTIIIAIGGSSGGNSQVQEPVQDRPVVQTPIGQTATTGPVVESQPNSIRGTEPLPPPRPTATGDAIGGASLPTQTP